MESSYETFCISSHAVFCARRVNLIFVLCSCNQRPISSEKSPVESDVPSSALVTAAPSVMQTPVATPAVEEAGPKPLFENEYVRIYFTGYFPDESSLSFRVENLTDRTILFLNPLDLSGDTVDAEGFLLIDGAPHHVLPYSYINVFAGSFKTYQITAGTGPDSNGSYSMETLDADAKTAQFAADFFVCDENRNVLSKVTLPQIDLTDAAYFPLPNATSFTAKTLGGEDIDDSYFSEHKLTMVNFWATWCGPCVGEMPDIAALHTEYADKGFAVLGILVWDEGNEKSALDFLLSSKISYPVVAYDTVPLFTEIAATQQVIPFTIFYDAHGNPVGDVVLGSRTKAAWAEMIDELLLLVE